MNLRRFIFALACILFVIVTHLTAVQGESLWKKKSSLKGNILSDNKASNVGDIVTILVREETVIDQKEDIGLNKKTSTNGKIATLDLPKSLLSSPVFGILPKLGLDSDRDYQSKNDYGTNVRFLYRVTAVIKEKLPNGNLLIEASRLMVTGEEKRILKLSGIIRPIDINSDNTVYSEVIADAKITYEGDGILTSARRRGFLGKIMDKLWPF